jgi:uncharacterized protein YndB with AHSA1/START domain
MTNSSSKGASTRVSRVLRAGRKTVYEAFLDPASVAAWLPPNNMTGHVHVFDAREGGTFRISLTYRDPKHSLAGKTSVDTDTVQGRFVEMVPYEKIVEVVEFESQDPAFSGEMRIIATFADLGGGTEVTFVCQDIPRGIKPEDNEQGCRESLEKLAALIE